MPRKPQEDPRTLEVYRILADNIIRKRGTKRMSQKELSEAAGVSRSTIVGVEGGDGCSLENLIRIADALGCKPADLFITDEERKEVSYQHILLMEAIKRALSGGS